MALGSARRNPSRHRLRMVQVDQLGQVALRVLAFLRLLEGRAGPGTTVRRDQAGPSVPALLAVPLVQVGLVGLELESGDRAVLELHVVLRGLDDRLGLAVLACLVRRALRRVVALQGNPLVLAVPLVRLVLAGLLVQEGR